MIDVIKDNNKRGQLKRELSELIFQKYAINEFCLRNSQVIRALVNLKRRGVTEDRILQLNSFLENNGYKDMKCSS